MAISLWFLFWDISFSKITYQVNTDVSPFNLILMKGIVSFAWFVGYSRICKVNVFKFNKKYSDDLDEEESIDIHAFMLLMIAVISGWCASILEIIAIKSMQFSSTSCFIISNWSIITIILSITRNKDVKLPTMYGIISICLLFWSSNIWLIGQDGFISSIQTGYIQYILWAISWILFAISQVFLRDLNRKMHNLFYCTYFSIGYLIISLGVFTLSTNYLDLSLHNLYDLFINFLSSLWSAIFIYTLSLAHYQSNPCDLASSWNLLIVFAAVENWTYEEGKINYIVIIGAWLSWVSYILSFFPMKSKSHR